MSKASAISAVASKSALEGKATPLGWLCAIITVTALHLAAILTISFENKGAELASPLEIIPEYFSFPLASRKNAYTHSSFLPANR